MEKYNSRNPIVDNEEFQIKYGFNQEPMTQEKLSFRMDLLTEEFQETMAAYMQHNAEEWVDGHIDLIVIALGNLYLAGIDVNRAWAEVFHSNMSKTRGVKPGRENSGGFDVYKEPGKFVKADHSDNHGTLNDLFNKKN
jgi:predicted HAD superfamily Cof-like phosphohydrolase